MYLVRHVVTLIHGTWARDAVWTQRDSPLCQALEKEFGSDLSIRVFPWSGRNSFSARSLAAIELRAFLTEGFHAFPESGHSIVAHSHGGNVALYALEQESIAENVSKIVCLSTPFIVVSERDFGGFTSAFTLTLRAALALLFAIIVNMKIAVLRGWWHAASHSDPGSFVHQVLLYSWGIQFVVLGLIGYGSQAVLVFRWSSFVDKLKQQLTTHPYEKSKLLVIRAPADEASGALTVAVFVGWLITKMWIALSYCIASPTLLFAALHAWQEKRPAQSFASLFSLGFLVFAGWWVYMVVYGHDTTLATLAHNSPRWYIVPTALFGSLVVLLLLGMIEITVALSCGIAGGILFLLFTFPLSLTLLPFSPVLAFAAVPLRITVEGLPPGAYRCVQITPPSSGALMHSTTYNDPEAIREIAEWVRGAEPKKMSAGA